MTPKDDDPENDRSQPRPLTPEALRAMEEAEARRRQREGARAHPKEVGGRDGPEPTRFGDWEKGGITSDF
jgi:hypothetical protein